MKERNYDAEDVREETSSKSRKHNVLSYLICALAAIVIWLVIMNVTDIKTPGSVEEEKETQDVSFELTV